MKLTVPFYLHKAGAGFPSPATDYIEEDVDLNIHLIKNVHDELVVKNFVKTKDEQFLASGSKKIEDKIIVNSESDVFVWGVVTYVIHSVY